MGRALFSPLSPLSPAPGAGGLVEQGASQVGVVVEGGVRGLEGREVLALVICGLLLLLRQVDLDHPDLIRGDVVWGSWRGEIQGKS